MYVFFFIQTELKALLHFQRIVIKSTMLHMIYTTTATDISSM